MSMRVGLHPDSYVLEGVARPGPMFARILRQAEQAGVSAIALMDHFLPPGASPVDDPMLEGYTTLGFAAAHTRSTDLMLLVSGVTHRHPVLMAKAVTTLDVLSGGRARLGVGAGWFERENRAYGLPFPAVSERFEILDETLAIIRHLWAPGDSGFNGQHFSLESTLFSPQPLRQPTPPILIGGNGRQRTLRLVARHADACNFLVEPGAHGPPLVAELLEILRQHCDEMETDYDLIAKTILYAGRMEIDRPGTDVFLHEMRTYQALGVSEVFVMPWGHDLLAFVDALGTHIIPALTAKAP
ncbi:MAG: TIGR03560 family F420-dependent LLM class oxidoreductase [Candidatus Nanopelagicales bacterium]